MATPGGYIEEVNKEDILMTQTTAKSNESEIINELLLRIARHYRNGLGQINGNYSAVYSKLAAQPQILYSIPKTAKELGFQRNARLLGNALKQVEDVYGIKYTAIAPDLLQYSTEGIDTLFASQERETYRPQWGGYTY